MIALVELVAKLVYGTGLAVAVCLPAGMGRVMPGCKLSGALAMWGTIQCRTVCNECMYEFIAFAGLCWPAIVVYHVGGLSLAAPFAGRAGLTSLDGS